MTAWLRRLGEWRRRLWYLLNRRRFDAQLRAEMESHAAMLGRPARFGNALRLREEARDVWGWARLDALGRDLRLAARTWRRTPGVAIAAVVSLGLGLALAATTMAVANAYLVRALPAPHGDRLYHVIYTPPGQPEPRGMSAIDWARLGDVIDVADSSYPARYVTRDGGAARELAGLFVSEASVDAIGARAIAGRTLEPADYRADADPVAMIGHSYWLERFGGSPAAIGATLRAASTNTPDTMLIFRIVGVLPPGFRSVRDYQRPPVEIVSPQRVPMRTYMVRLRDGVAAATAERRITEEARSVANSLPPGWPGIRLESVHARHIASVRQPIVAIVVAAALVLAIVCANVAVLLLLRALKRQKEVAVRIALGAGRRHISRMLVLESALLSATALVLGIGSSMIALRALSPLIEEQLGRVAPGGPGALTFDPLVLAAMAGVGLLVGGFLAAMPLLAPWHRRLADALRRDLRTGTDGPSMRRLRTSLIAIEIAGSLALLAGCGLMVRSVVHLVTADLGFNAAEIQRARIALPPGYTDRAGLLRFYDAFLPRLQARFGDDAALTNFIPFYPAPAQSVEADAGAPAGLEAGVLAVTDAYFTTLQVSVREGRVFSQGDTVATEPVAIVSETLARRLWPSQAAIGRLIRTSESAVPRSALGTWRTVVGVARDVRQTHSDVDQNDIYVPFRQAPNRYAPLFVRTASTSWVTDVQAMIAAVDPQVMLTPSAPLQREGDALLVAPKFLMTMLTAFAVFAALVAAIGIYGVTAYGVRQREREVAIRMALGATSGRMIAMFLREGGVMLGAGLAGGLAGAVVVSRLLQSQLHGISGHDPLTLTAAVVAVVVVASLAIWVPARRAMSARAIDALRAE